MSRGPRGPGKPPGQAPQKPKEKPWFGKRCKRCDSPINYAFKSVIEGWCGKCTDEVRNVFVRELRTRAGSAETAVETSAAPLEAAAPSRFPPFLIGLVLTLLLVAGAAVAVPQPFDAGVAALRGLVDARR